MLWHFRLLTFLLTFGAGALGAHASNRCEGVFMEGTYHRAALSEALTKAHSSKKNPGLSSRDLDFLIERVFDKKEGRRHLVSEYWTKSTQERTYKVLARQISEAVTKRGLLEYFERNNLLIEKSTLRTKIEIINRSPTFNVISGLWSTFATLKGAPPVLLPEGSFKLKPADFNTLLLKGLESAEGQAIASKYQLRFEFNRGFDLFSRYYTRVALAALLYIVYDKAQNYLEKGPAPEDEAAFEEIMKQVDSIFGSDEKIETKNDILFATVVTNFKNKYSRLPNEQEMSLICRKIYGQSGCP